MGPLVFVLLAWSLYKKVYMQPDFSNRWQHIKESIHNPLLWLVLLLMLVNWALESRKWQLLAAPLEKISFPTAVKSVLAGCSITMLTPNRIGEYGGRILYMQEQNRLKAISHTILGSMSQLFVTLIMGSVGLFYFRFISNEGKMLNVLISPFLLNILLYISVLVSVGLLMLYLRAGFLVTLIHKAGVFKKFVKYIEHLGDFSRKQLLRILFLSILRYMVFILQYMLLLHVMQVTLNPVLCFWLLAIYYWLLAFTPTIGFTELPIRATASVQLLQVFTANILGIEVASFAIWLINLVLPAIGGSILILKLKIIKEND